MSHYGEIFPDTVRMLFRDLQRNISNDECAALAATVLAVADIGQQNPLGRFIEVLPSSRKIIAERLQRLYFGSSTVARQLDSAEYSIFEHLLATDYREQLLRLCVTESYPLRVLVSIRPLLAQGILECSGIMLLPKPETTQRLEEVFRASCLTYINQGDPLSPEHWHSCVDMINRLIDGKFVTGYSQLYGVTNDEIRRIKDEFQLLRSRESDKTLWYALFKCQSISFATELSALATMLRDNRLSAPTSEAMMELAMALDVVKGSWNPPT